MPEGPEVRVMADYLAQMLTGLKCLNVKWDEKSRFHKHGLSGYDTIENRFPAIIEGIGVKGKKVLFIFRSEVDGSDFYLIVSLGMEGKFIWQAEKHSNLWWEFEDKNLYFDDSRHYGHLEFFKDSDSVMKKLNSLGPDVLAYAMYLKGEYPGLDESEHLTTDRWREIFRNKRLKQKEVGVFLLDPKRISSVGNYLKSEILYISRVSPHRYLEDLTDEEIESMRLASLDIIYRSYKSQGHTLRSYKPPSGDKGEFTCLVYNQDYCPLGYPIIKTILKDNRYRHWVPDIQK